MSFTVYPALDLRNGQVVPIADAGHNVQHDQPECVAQVIEAFLRRD